MSLLEHVASNLRALRHKAALSQQALADAAGVSRRMLVAIESGDANVSLNTLDRLADALHLKFADLLRDATATDPTRIQALAWRGNDPRSQGVLLATAAVSREVELWQWTLMPGDRYVSAADPAGWSELIVVIEGTLVIEAAMTERHVAAGDFLVFASDEGDYAYRNDGPHMLRFVRNVVR